MVELELEPELQARVERLAAQSKVSASFVVHAAVERFVEDREDYEAGIRAQSATKYLIDQDEMERRSSVAD